MCEVYICSAKRTPIGSFLGGLATSTAVQLGAAAINGMLGDSPELKGEVTQVIFGSVLTAGQGQAPARQAARAAGLPDSASALTVNKVCSSGLKAIQLGVNEVLLGNAELVVAGGMESMSRSPHLLPGLRAGVRLGQGEVIDSVVHDGLWDPYHDFHMGLAGELCARTHVISREDQDAFARLSYERALLATGSGHFQAELDTSLMITADEEPGRGRLDKFTTLKPAFSSDGTITAANASSLSDGAAAVLLASAEAVNRLNLTPLARIVAAGWHSAAPEWFTTAPVMAVDDVLKRAGVCITQVDLFEINEAFAVVPLHFQRTMNVPFEKINVCGGAIALGHPIGASGARIVVTLVHQLRRLGLKTGCAAICNGGGEATSLLVEAL
ncbi:MAG: thiolase family protein [bacterium]|nr:thiolase family protein [bacterium]